MKICVLNGSPKGEYSGTEQYARYIEKKIPGHQFTYFSIAHDIKKIEKDQALFDAILKEIEGSDCVIWAFPLYVLLVHAHYKRFIELVWERGKEGAFRGKYAALVAGSIHFFDNTAINYMHAVCDDLEMQYFGAYSADMEDFMNEDKRAQFLGFGRMFLEAAETKLSMPRAYPAIRMEKAEYSPGQAKPLDMRGQKAVIVTDTTDMNENIGKMVERFRVLTRADVIDISKIKILASCQGCIQCGYDNVCVFHGKDDIEETYGRLSQYDIIVYAGAMRDRYLSARFKMFLDRRFFKTHQPHYTGKQIGYLVSGPLGQNQNLMEIFEGMAQLEFSNLCGIASDEGTSAETDRLMDSLAVRLIESSVQQYVAPATFLGVGGLKIFRDDIWGRLRFPFRMDHIYYKKNGIYDFPQKDIKHRFQNAFMLLLCKFPKIRKAINSKMEEYMVMPYKKVLEKE